MPGIGLPLVKSHPVFSFKHFYFVKDTFDNEICTFSTTIWNNLNSEFEFSLQSGNRFSLEADGKEKNNEIQKIRYFLHGWQCEHCNSRESRTKWWNFNEWCWSRSELRWEQPGISLNWTQSNKQGVRSMEQNLWAKEQREKRKKESRNGRQFWSRVQGNEF